MFTLRDLLTASLCASLLSLSGCFLIEDPEEDDTSAETGTWDDTAWDDTGSDDTAWDDTSATGGVDTGRTDPGSVPGGDGTLPVVEVPIATSYADLTQKYDAATDELLDANGAFILAYQAYVTANPYEAGFSAKVNDFVIAGERWYAGYQSVVLYGQQYQSFAEHGDFKGDGPLLTAPIPSPALPYNVGNLIGSTAEKRQQIEDMLDSGQIDENQYMDMLNELKKTNALEAVAAELAAGAGVVGGVVVKAGLVLAGASGGVVAGGAILGGIAIGATVKFMWSWCSGGKSDDWAGATCALSTWEGKVGDVVPMQFAGQGTMIIQVEGYPPVTLEDFGVDDGEILQIDFPPPDPNTGEGGDPTITTVDPSTLGGDCATIVGISAATEPHDPGPGESVTVRATSVPPMAGCSMSFTVSGTDGYSNSSTVTTDAYGSGSFYIPGGGADVVDTVGIEINGKQTTIVYVF